MPAGVEEWTVDLLHEIPDDGQRYEIIDGELFVTPSPGMSHQDLVFHLAKRLDAYIGSAPIGKVMISPADVRIQNSNKTSVQPDVYIIRRYEGVRPQEPYLLHQLLFAAEVLSGNRRSYDYVVKRDLYLRNSIGTYWVIDPKARTFTCWNKDSSAPEVRADSVIWWPEGMTAPLELDLPEFFKTAFA